MKKTKKFSQNSKLARTKKKFSFAGSQKKTLRGNSRLPLSLDRLHSARRLISQLLRTDSRVAANLRSRTKHLYRFLGVRRSNITVFARLNHARQLKNVHSFRVVAPSLVGKYRIRGGSLTPRRASLAFGRLPLRSLARAASLSLLTLQKSRVRSAASARTQKLCWILAENRAALRALRLRRRRATRSSRRRPKIFWKRQKNFKKVINKIGVRRQVGRKQNSYGKQPGSLFLTAIMLGAMRTRQIRKKRRVMYSRRVRRWWWRAGISIHCRRRRSRARFSYPNKRQRWRVLRRDPRLMKHERQRRLSETTVALGLRAAGLQLSVRYAQNSKQLNALQSMSKGRRPITRMLRRRALRQLVRSTGLSSARSQTARLDTRSRHVQTLSKSCRVVCAPLPIKSGLLSSIVRAKNYKFKVIKFNRIHRTRSYAQWQSRRSTSKLQFQRILRTGMLMPKTGSLGGYTVAARISSVKGMRNALLRKHQKYSDDATLLTGIQPVPQTAHLAKRFQRAHMCNQNVYAPSLSFLSRASHTRTQKQTVKEIQAEGLLSQQLKRYHAAQLVHRRSKLRLPDVSVTRIRRRKSGLVAFARNSLKRPQTLHGRQQQFLPSVNARTAFKAAYRRIQAANPNALHAYEKREDTLPLFWKKPHNRANRKAINKIRRRRYDQYQRFYQGERALAQLRASAPLGKAESIVPQISARLQGLNNTSYNPPRTLKHALPVTSQTGMRNALLTSRQSRSVQRLHGLWQTRSVHAMLKNERGLSAWSPQISARNRRKHYPRVGVVVAPRRRLTFRARRIRNTDNAVRLRRGIPQRRYTDHTRVKLQYLFGSVGSAGYTRLRRVHRAHSEHNRWWRPTKRGVPFAHPYSRRELNAIRYKKVSFSKVLQPATGGFAKVFDPIKIVSLHTKFPPRTIPWRNFHYRRPRYRDAPKTLQRWTFTPRTGKTSRIRPVCKKITIAQPLRTMRKILNAASGFGSYKNHRWGTLDTVTLNSNASGQFYHAIRCVPDSVWAALRDSAGSSAAYVALRQKIFSNFRVQLHKFQVMRPSVSSQAAETAVQTLLALIRAVMANSRIALTISATEKHLRLRETAFSARAELKALRHLKLRELPQAGIELSPDDLLRREQSKAYKRWLAGAEGVLKRPQLGYTPTSRSRYTDNVATSYGRQRVRFPASGRRRKSYDSLLHAFAKKVSPSRFRRTSKFRFQWAKPQLSTNFQENVSALTPLFGSNRRQYLAQKLSSVAYLSPSMRELLAHRTAANSFGTITKPLAISTKRRFISLPMNRVFREHRRALRKLHTPYKQAMYSIRAGILRRALRQRRKERAYIDLRLAIRQRRLPREKPKNYRKQQRKQNLRRRFAARRGKYSRRSVRKRTKSSSRWTLRHLSAIGSRRGRKRKERLPLVLPYGENVTIPWTTVRKRVRAIRGFTHPVNRRSRRRLRRRVRDTSRRKRRARRGKIANRRRAKRRVSHWSEKRMRRLRKNSFSLRKNTIARIFSSKIVTKAKKRFSSMSGGRNVNSRLLRFFSRKTSNAYAAASRIPEEQPSFLVFTKSSTVHNHKYINRFIGKSRMSRRRGRVLQVSTPVLRRARIERALDAARNLAVSSVANRLVSATPRAPITTPLWFEAPVTHVIKSAAVKEQEAEAAVAAKEGSFRLPAQYVEGVTTLIPELINSMLSTRINNSNISYATTKQTIRNIYWSLRVYLNVDPFDSRFFVRDKVPAARVRVFEEMTDLSVFQKTLQPDRAALRYRFQPSRLVRAKNTARFREDWLRAFFPARHALYQENAEDYGKFLVATHRIRRLRIGPRGMGSWRTVANIGGLEIRARQLLKLRLSRRRSRFETVLQTTRRLAAEEPAPQMPTFARESFFSRLFSTYSSRGLSLTSRWMHRQKRFVSLNAGWRSVSPVALNTVRNRLVPRLEARGKSRYITTDWAGITSSLLDGRFSRTKSPRSRQYLIRLPKQPNVQAESRIADILSYREATSRFIPQGTPLTNKWTRVRRGTWPRAFKQVMQSTIPRKEYALRRVQDALFSRSDTIVTKKLKSLRPAVRNRLPKHRTAAVTYKRGKTLRSASIFGTRVFKRVRRAPGTLAARQPLSSNKKIRMGISVRPESRIFAKKFYLDGTATRAARSNQNLGYFASSAGWQITRGADLARAAAMHTRVRRQAPFDNYRPYLWNKLTLRKMKKFRIGKYWIRDTSHWLRDPWLSKIVAPDMSLRRDQFGGELRSRTQQVGEYVADVDATGKDIPRSDAPKERHKFQKIMPEFKDTEINKTNRILKYGSIVNKTVALHRLQIASQARRKPVPSMRLANYEYRDVIREHKEEKAKSPKQRMEEEQARVAAYWRRKSKRLSPIRARRLPLKHPANLWLPHVIWKDIQRRVRKFDWRESDQVFARRGYRGAFRFRPTERRKAPWLEPLMYTRVAYSTRLKAFRRRQFPHEQKKFKWLQRVRKVLYPGKRRKYIKRRKWPQLKRYNQKLHYSLFNLRDRGAARTHFKRLNGRTRPTVSAFVSMSKGLTDRLDVTCLKMQFAPTIYWARIVSEFGLLRVNGVTIYNPSYRLKPADVIYPNWDVVARFQHYFQPYLSWRQLRRNRNKSSTAFYPTNMEYQPGIRAIVYKHAPDESDLRKRSRVHPTYLRWFKLDSV